MALKAPLGLRGRLVLKAPPVPQAQPAPKAPLGQLEQTGRTA